MPRHCLSLFAEVDEGPGWRVGLSCGGVGHRCFDACLSTRLHAPLKSFSCIQDPTSPGCANLAQSQTDSDHARCNCPRGMPAAVMAMQLLLTRQKASSMLGIVGACSVIHAVKSIMVIDTAVPAANREGHISCGTPALSLRALPMACCTPSVASADDSCTSYIFGSLNDGQQ
jgi:hypothetical protein